MLFYESYVCQVQRYRQAQLNVALHNESDDDPEEQLIHNFLLVAPLASNKISDIFILLGAESE